jgi:hypothetical protein
MADKQEVAELKEEHKCLDEKVGKLSVTNFYDGPLEGDVEIDGKIYPYKMLLMELGWMYDENKKVIWNPACDKSRYYLVYDENDKPFGYITEYLISCYRGVWVDQQGIKCCRDSFFDLREKLEEYKPEEKES